MAKTMEAPRSASTRRFDPKICNFENEDLIVIIVTSFVYPSFLEVGGRHSADPGMIPISRATSWGWIKRR